MSADNATGVGIKYVRAPVAVATSDAERAALISAAKKILGRLCEKGLLSMSIPVRPTDEDMILCEVIDLASRSPLPIDFKQATDQGGWQPIATAPKGWQSLLYSEKRACVVIDDWGDYDRHNQPKFTHWMPLPAAPTLLGVADGDAVGGKSGGAE